MLEQLIISAKNFLNNLSESEHEYIAETKQLQKTSNYICNQFEREIIEYCKKRRFKFNLEQVTSFPSYSIAINDFIESRAREDLPIEQFSNNIVPYNKHIEIGGFIGVNQNKITSLTYSKPNPKQIGFTNIITPVSELHQYSSIINWHTHSIYWPTPTTQDLESYNLISSKIKKNQNIFFIIYIPKTNESTWYKPVFLK